ncbi:MAG: SprT-like family protein [Planctomycetaceae bacterium]|nr:SprT-like family protein [Planctomycetaceae bacterium]
MEMDLKELEVIASQELAKHNLHGWTFGWANTKRRVGVCKYHTKRIEIARYYALNSPPELVLDTLWHEIALAIVGPGKGHGPAWKAVARQLGATPTACETSPDAALTPGDWQATCPDCQKTFHRYKRPMAAGGYRCRCPARSALTFEFMGDPALKPPVPLTVQESARWEAKCAGCQTVHFKMRRPKAGVWRCRCPQHCELIWQFRSPTGSQQ